MSLAEQKYDLALVNTVSDKKIRQKPCEGVASGSEPESELSGRLSERLCGIRTGDWGFRTPTSDYMKRAESFWYKERLKTNYIKSLKPSDTNKNLVGKNWIFLKDGLDDFRDGLPPPVEGDITLKQPKGVGPNIKDSSDDLSSVKRPAVRKRFDKNQVCFSRQTPQQQQRREHINEIEYGLTQHPLALYPHLEESVNPELFEDIMNILDPEMNLMEDEDDDDGSLQEEEEGEGSRASDDSGSNQDIEFRVDNREIDEGTVRNPYKWISKKEEEKKRERKKAGEKTTDSTQEEHIKSVTKEFCDWVSSLGGESNNIEESTITSLFASGYETKPALSVPIHVVELTNVPPELRMSATVPQQQQQSKNLPQEEKDTTRWEYSGNYEPSWIKFKYGAWYLDPKSWEKRDFDKPLMDPKALKDQEMSEAKKKSKLLNNDLATMHGVNLFNEFMEKKQRRKPEFLYEVEEIQKKAAEEEQRRIEFLDEVEEIQKKAAEEEQRRIEAELAAKKKRSHRARQAEGEETPALTSH